MPPRCIAVRPSMNCRNQVTMRYYASNITATERVRVDEYRVVGPGGRLCCSTRVAREVPPSNSIFCSLHLRSFVWLFFFWVRGLMNSHEQAGATLRSLAPGRFVGQRHEVRMPWPRRRPGRRGHHVVCCLQLVTTEMFQRQCVELEFRTHRGPTKFIRGW